MTTMEERTEQVLREVVAADDYRDGDTHFSEAFGAVMARATDHLEILDRKRADDARVDGLYPEHAKLHAVKDHSQAIGEFLDYGPWTLMEWQEDIEQHVPVRGGIEAALARYFKIDRDKLEQEKRAMLKSIQEAQP